MTALAPFVLIVIVLFLGVAAFGPPRVRIVLLHASDRDWLMVPLFAAIVFAVIAI